ncbi:hypothetical protein [Haladaptatus sp. NG-WS-4]
MTKDDRYGATDDDYGDDVDSYGSEKPPSANGDTTDGPVTTENETALPFIFARRTVKADREAVPVYVQDDTATEIDDLERELSQAFAGDKVMALDVREALIRAGLENVDDVRRVMEEWGYGRR